MALVHKILIAPLSIKYLELFHELSPDYLDKYKKKRNVSMMVQKLEKNDDTFKPLESVF